jgi:conjugative transposon TraM protein
MEKTNHSAKFLKRRNLLVILPVLTLPFMTLMFWAFGGGKGNATAQTDVHAGLNLKLPDAKFKEQKGLNKLSFYEQAALDSAKTKAAEKLDPYWNKVSNESNLNDSSTSLLNGYSMDVNKRKVYDKLDELKKALNKSEEASKYNQKQSNPYSLQSFSSSGEADRLQTMMQKMKEDKSEDPEITQLNSMLDKIMAIQNPEQTKNSVKPSSDKSLSVKTKKQSADISLLKPDVNKTLDNDTAVEGNVANAFYSASDNVNDDDSITANSIEAIIPETQTIVAGATVKLALSNDVTIKNVPLPAGTFIYGSSSLSNERLEISINSIRCENSILPVSLDVYDLDGQEGIYIPGSINRTVAKESANNAMGGMNATTIDPTIGAQAASAGIEAAKSLFSKKVKLVKMTVRAGYKVLLKDNHER